MINVARTGRGVRRALRRHRSVITPGARPIRIDDLISPLRYDVLVREQFLRFLSEHLDLYGTDFEEFVFRSKSQRYHAWFETVAIHRIRPGTEGEKALDVAFRERIHKTVRLYRAITGSGFDDRYPIMVRTAGPVVTTDTGKTLAGRLFPSDGCHRLALLRMLGHRRLPPSWYRLHTEPGWRPPDNTHALLDALPVTPGEYFSFLSLGYADLVLSDQLGLLEHVAATRPGHLDELRRVITVDSARLRSGA